MLCKALIAIVFSVLFEVVFVETIYTVPESVGSVEVCVNLTQPQIDILDEFVVVEVYDFPSSVLIPADVTLASEPVYIHINLVFNSLFFQLLMCLTSLAYILWHQGLTFLSRQWVLMLLMMRLSQS